MAITEKHGAPVDAPDFQSDDMQLLLWVLRGVRGYLCSVSPLHDRGVLVFQEAG